MDEDLRMRLKELSENTRLSVSSISACTRFNKG